MGKGVLLVASWAEAALKCRSMAESGRQAQLQNRKPRCNPRQIELYTRLSLLCIYCADL